MKLFEFATGWEGATFETAYVWAETEARARELFARKHGATREVATCVVRELFDGTAGEFVTELSSEGWPD